MSNITYPGLHFSVGANISAEDKSNFKPKYPDGWNPTIFQPETGLGLLYRSSFDETARDTFTYKGIEMEFVDFWPTNLNGNPFNFIRACYTEAQGGGSYQLNTIWIHISRIELFILKQMELWQHLSDELKKKIETGDFSDQNTQTQEIKGKEEPARRGKKRNSDYAHFPRELNCSTEGCEGKMKYISPTMLIAKANEKEITPEEYAKTWHCSKCEPRRFGRKDSKINPDFAGIPHKTNCVICNKKITLSQQNIVDKAKFLGITTKELVKNYKCRGCGGRISKSTVITDKNGVTTTTTNGFKGRKANPDSPWFGKTKELKCSCGITLIQQPSSTYRQAEKLGISYEDYVLAWKCKKCRNPTITTTTITRGRKPNPEFIGLPKMMTCKCGKEVASNLAYLKIKAEAANTTIQNLIENYQCQKCRSEKLIEQK